MTKRAVDYTRLSGGNSETSIDRQHGECLEYIEERDDLKHTNWYNEGKRSSGWDKSREKYQQLLTDAREDEFDVLVVRDGSRIGRDKVERLDTFTDLANKYDIEFHTTSRGYVDPENPTDLLMEVFSAAQDDDGKKGEVENAQKEIERRIKRPETYHGGVPFGFQYTEDGRHLTTDEDEWEQVKKALELRFLKGKGGPTIEDATGVTTSTQSRLYNNTGDYGDGNGRLDLCLEFIDENEDEELFVAINEEIAERASQVEA